MLKLFSFLVLFGLSAPKRFTPLEIDNHPCTPENLKLTNRYICDHSGNVICSPGWTEPEIISDLTILNPCLEPVCSKGCVNGRCRAPDFCACDIGWEGEQCSVCVPLPGCMHGFCDEALECKCFPGWEGSFCTLPECNNCINGYCTVPNKCKCADGWSGSKCDVCDPLPGCVHGVCKDHPNTCICNPGWGGHLCDVPSCRPPCVNGVCTEGSNGLPNYCLCKSGYKGVACEKCSPYWICPNQGPDACNLPNECLCFNNEPDPNQLCNNTALVNMGTNSDSGLRRKRIKG